MAREHAVWKHFKKGNNKYLLNGTHKEAWCHCCIEAQVSSIHASEVDAERRSVEARAARDEQEIRHSLYCSSTALCGKIDRLLAHLAKECVHIDPEEKDWAQHEYRMRKQKEGERQFRANSDSSSSTLSELIYARKCLSSSPDPSSILDHRPRKSRRTGFDSSVVDENVPPGEDADSQSTPLSGCAPWPQWFQAEFASDLCRLFLVANIAWWALDIPFVRYFFSKYVSQADLPGRRELAGRVLNEEAKKVTDIVKAEVKGRYATGQCDGWKNISKDHIIATMVNAEYTTYLVHTFCITKDRKTADNLLKIVLDQINFYTDVLKVHVVAWCTDASGEAAKMRRLLVQRIPSLVVVDCWAHQMNLVTGDVLKHATTKFTTVLDDALEVVKWFNNHTRALGMLKDAMVQKFGRSLCLILPVITRWTSHYLAVRRLLEVQRAFRQLLIDGKEEDLVLAAGEKEESRVKAQEIINRLKRPGFFEELEDANRHLAPLATATNILQTDHTRLDTVLITLANLYRIFSNPRLDATIRNAVLRSLEKRWAKQDQAIFILAVVFNPAIRVSAFAANSPFRQPNVIKNFAVEAFKRFFCIQPDNEFMTAITQYLNRLGPWSDDRMGVAYFQKEARNKGLPINLVDLWRNMIPICDSPSEDAAPPPPPNGAAGLANLALRIASIVPNTASNERIFSQFKIIHSAIRNRLSHEKVRKQTLIRADVMRTHPMRLRGQKRKFGEELDANSVEGSSSDRYQDGQSSGSGELDDPSLSPLLRGFADTIQSLVEEAEEDEMLPGVLDNEHESHEQSQQAGSQEMSVPSSSSPALQPSLCLRICIPPELRDKQALKLRFLFPRSDDTAAAASSVFDEFWIIGEQALASEERMQETLNEAEQQSSMSPPRHDSAA